jgi:periplasmic protein CpxP/Spy
MRVKILLIATLVAVGFSTANAQQQNGQKQPRMSPEELAKRQTEQMTTDLNLNDKQKADVSAVNIKYANKISEMFQANKGDREAMRAKFQEMMIQKNAELKKVLTDDQYKLYEELEKKKMEEHRKQMEQRQGQQGVPGSGQDQRSK